STGGPRSLCSWGLPPSHCSPRTSKSYAAAERRRSTQPIPPSARRLDDSLGRSLGALWGGACCRGEGHKPPALLVVKLKSQGADAGPEAERRHVVEHRVLIVGALEVVVRDARVQVVNVVQPDVASEELQDLRQLEVRAATKCRVLKAPAGVGLPV